MQQRVSIEYYSTPTQSIPQIIQNAQETNKDTR